jgi:hypothetical protein
MNDIVTFVEWISFSHFALSSQALFENLTVQPQFAHFFLAFMMGRYNFTGLVNDLQTLDADLFRNLMFLKTYEVRNNAHLLTL